MSESERGESKFFYEEYLEYLRLKSEKFNHLCQSSLVPSFQEFVFLNLWKVKVIPESGVVVIFLVIAPHSHFSLLKQFPTLLL